MAKRSASDSTSSTLTSANPNETISAGPLQKTTRKVAVSGKAKDGAPKAKLSVSSIPMSRNATDGSGSTASRSRRSTAARGTKRKYVELSEDDDNSQDVDGSNATKSSSGDSDDPDAVPVSASRESSVLDPPNPSIQETINKPGRSRPRKKGQTRDLPKRRKRIASETESGQSQSPQAQSEKPYPLKIKIAARSSTAPSEASSSRQPSPIPHVLRGLVKAQAQAQPEQEEESISRALLAAYGDNSNEDDDSIDSLTGAAIQPFFDERDRRDHPDGEITQDTTILGDSLSVSADPEPRETVSEVDFLAVQGDDEATPAVTPAEELQVELSVPILVQEATPLKRKRGRPKKVPNATPTPSKQSSRAPSAARSGSEAPPAVSEPSKLVTESPRLLRRKSAVVASDMEADKLKEVLAYERRLIEEDRHPLLLEALGPWRQMKTDRLTEFEKLHQAKLEIRAKVLEADERQKWVQWEDAKRSIWFEMFHFLEQKSQRLELEYGDDEYSSIMCPIVKVQQAPEVLPMVRLEGMDERGITSNTFSPYNEDIGQHATLDTSISDIDADLQIMGLDQTLNLLKRNQQLQKKSIKSFPLGPGPAKPKPNKPKARFLDSRHPLRQIQPATADSAQTQAVQITMRRPSLEETALRETERRNPKRGGASKADAIVIGDDTPGSAPLTMESLAKLEQEAALSEQRPLYSGRKYAEMPRFPGRPTIYDPSMAPHGYAGEPPPSAGFAHIQPRPSKHARPPTDFPQGVRRQQQGRPVRADPTAPKDGETRKALDAAPKSARRADLAQQARIQLGLDPAPASAAYTAAGAGFPPPPSSGYPYAGDYGRYHGDPRQYSPPQSQPPPHAPSQGYMYPHQIPYHPYEQHQLQHDRRPSQSVAGPARYPRDQAPLPPDWAYHQHQYSGHHPAYGWPGEYPPPPPGYPHHDPRYDYMYGRPPPPPPQGSPPDPRARQLYPQPGYYPSGAYPRYDDYPAHSQQIARRPSGGAPSNSTHASHHHHHHQARPEEAQQMRWG